MARKLPRMLRWEEVMQLVEQNQRSSMSMNYEQDKERINLEREAQISKMKSKWQEMQRLQSRIGGGEACPICQEEFLESDLDIMYTSLCNHLSHSECMDLWKSSPLFRRNPTCPLCRTPMLGTGTQNLPVRSDQNPLENLPVRSSQYSLGSNCLLSVLGLAMIGWGLFVTPVSQEEWCLIILCCHILVLQCYFSL